MVADTASTRPLALTPDPEGLPGELRGIASWGVWEYTWTGDKWDKPPQSPRGYAASNDDDRTWGSFDDALARYRQGGLDGLGFRLARTFGILVIDIDGCVRPDGTIEPWALFWVERLVLSQTG